MNGFPYCPQSHSLNIWCYVSRFERMSKSALVVGLTVVAISRAHIITVSGVFTFRTRSACRQFGEVSIDVQARRGIGQFFHPVEIYAGGLRKSYRLHNMLHCLLRLDHHTLCTINILFTAIAITPYESSLTDSIRPESLFSALPSQIARDQYMRPLVISLTSFRLSRSARFLQDDESVSMYLPSTSLDF